VKALALSILLFAGTAFANDSSVAVTTGVPGLFSVSYEHVFAEELGFEFAYGGRLTAEDNYFSLTPYILGAYYGETWGWWVEVATPEGLVPHIGDDEYWLRSGFEYRW